MREGLRPHQRIIFGQAPRGTAEGMAWSPAIEVKQKEGKLLVTAELPGLKKEDFKISLDKNVLSVSAEKKTENVDETKKYSKREYSYTSFVRSFTLPEVADQAKIEAEYTDGILKLNVAKKEEAKAQTREISVK